MYKVPQSWTIITLDKAGKWCSGGTPSRKRKEYFGQGVPWIKSGDLSDGFIAKVEEQITGLGLENSSAKLLPVNTISIAMYGATIGKLGIFTFPAATNQACANVIPESEIVDTKYLFFYLLSERTSLIERGKGGSQPNLSQEVIKGYPFKLAPLNEQRRIVAKLEKLLVKVDACKQRLEKIPTILARFRQSVLAAACSGRLTAAWREQNPDAVWKNTILSDLLRNKPRNGYSPKGVNYKTSVKSLTLAATTSGRFKPIFKYLDKQIQPGSHLWLEPGDILIQRSNTLEYVGTSAIYDGLSQEFIYPDLMMKLQIREDKAEIKYVCYSLSTLETRNYYRQNATGTSGNMPKINQTVVGNTPIVLPPLAEQQEIVRRVEGLLQKADRIERGYQKAKAQIDQLEQSILAKAFRGELVPQDPNDEPASVLLDRIREERAKEQEAKAAKKSPKKTSKATGRRGRKKAKPAEKDRGI